uniref:Tyrosine-protein kinase receptor n=2 Tax=Lepeophtheirus salmonis TaxID=72036 RepID=A0A0K2TIM1_LEPSM
MKYSTLFACIFLLLLRSSYGNEIESDIDGEEDDKSENAVNFDPPSTESTTTPRRQSTLKFIKSLKNMTKDAGDFLRLRCEVSGDPPATSIDWFKNGVPLIEEKNRMKVKTNLKAEPQWSILRVRALETLDKAFYDCVAKNGIDKITSTAVLIVELGKVNLDMGKSSGLLPETYSDPDFPNMHSEGSNIEFEGDQKPQFSRNDNAHNPMHLENIPNLKPDESGGSCQPYLGSVCSQYVGNEYVFVGSQLSQDYVEKKLQAAFLAISTSPDLSDSCSKWAIPAICLATFPLCDRHTEKPRKMCREECELLENSLCRKELAIARQHALLGRQMVLPVCNELPPIGTPESSNCIRLDIHQANQLVRPHSCYNGDGENYRGTFSSTKSGYSCLPWNRQNKVSVINNIELSGGHNYCRNPSGYDQMEEPWCFAGHDNIREVCGLPMCNDFNIYIYVAVPTVVAIALLGLLICVCCMRRKAKPTKPNLSLERPSTLSSGRVPNMEMNSLLPKSNMAQPQFIQQMQHPPPEPVIRVRAREFPTSSIRFMQELGEGAFGKVYKGELIGLGGAGTISLVAIKTLKPGATQKTRNDFQREADLMTDLRHPNIVCLLGVSFVEDPHCMIFEHMAHGDLHEFLITHSPNVDSDISEPATESNVLTPMDMSFIAIQIAAGMEYLAGHHYVHRDLAARNCLVGENLTVKISDFGLSRDIYSADYYRVQSKSLLPVRWMPPESILYGKFTTESDVWSFGVILWEIYSFGLQPYYGYSNSEVIEMIRSRQLLPCPEDCPSRTYAFMVECWHEVPSRRPTFNEIHSRLRHWEGFSSGGYQPSSTSHSMSQHSGSHHSSTGPSNNTGSTNLSGMNHHLMQQQQQQHHHPGYRPSVGLMQMAKGPNGGPHTLLAYPNANCQTGPPMPLQMV